MSLWSADLLDIRSAVLSVDTLCAAFHIDVFDGHNVPDLLFGPDFVAQLCDATNTCIDVHLNVSNPLYWVDRFADAGAGIITVQAGACTDLGAVLDRIRKRGCRAGLGLELHEPVELAARYMGQVDRILVMGTAIGVKGVGLDPRTPSRVAEVVLSRRQLATGSVEIDVDGGIRRHTVGLLAAAGADGVVPGSLVFSAPDPAGVLRGIAELVPGDAVPSTGFWSHAEARA